MSHTLHPLRQARLQRSELAVPGSNPDFIEKAAASAADYVFLDLEDASHRRRRSRPARTSSLRCNDIDWRGLGKTVSVRINGLDTHYMYRDVVDVMEQAGDRVDTLLVPRWACRPTSMSSRRWSTRSSRPGATRRGSPPRP